MDLEIEEINIVHDSLLVNNCVISSAKCLVWLSFVKISKQGLTPKIANNVKQLSSLLHK